jgi:hypothetical protein
LINLFETQKNSVENFGIIEKVIFVISVAIVEIKICYFKGKNMAVKVWNFRTKMEEVV